MVLSCGLRRRITDNWVKKKVSKNREEGGMWFGVVIENGCDKRKGPRWDVQMRRQEEWRSELFVLWEEEGGVRTNQVRRKSSSRWAKRGILQHYVGNWCRTQVRVSKKDKCSEQSEFSHLALRCREATLLFTVICYNASKLSQGFVICDWPHTYLATPEKNSI